jgi:hypothetical protein
MSPKIILWLAVAGLSSIWYALDPEAGGPLFPAPTRAAARLAVAPGFDRPLARHP